jgi:hypothetical protein
MRIIPQLDFQRGDSFLTTKIVLRSDNRLRLLWYTTGALLVLPSPPPLILPSSSLLLVSPLILIFFSFSPPQVISTPPPAIVSVAPSPRTYLLHLISNVLPPEKLAGVVEIVNTTSHVSKAESEEEIELEFGKQTSPLFLGLFLGLFLFLFFYFYPSLLDLDLISDRFFFFFSSADINALDEVTLKRLERYVESCLEFTKPKKRSTKTKRKGGKRASKKKELRLSLAAMGEVLTMKHDILTEDESEVIDIMD